MRQRPPAVAALFLAALWLFIPGVRAGAGLRGGGVGPQESPSPSPSPTPAPAPGDVIPPFDAPSLVGNTVHVEFPKGSTTILLFFLSGCPHCHKMIPEWNRAYDARPKGLAVTGILMNQEPPGFFAAMPISFPVVRSPGTGFLRAMKIYRAPVTLRVAAGGRVEDVGLGVLDPIRLGELFRRP